MGGGFGVPAIGPAYRNGDAARQVDHGGQQGGAEEVHCLEHMLFMTALAVRSGELGRDELLRLLGRMAGWSHEYSPQGEEPKDLRQKKAEFERRFARTIKEFRETVMLDLPNNGGKPNGGGASEV